MTDPNVVVNVNGTSAESMVPFSPVENKLDIHGRMTMDINQESLVAIAVSQAETSIRARIADLVRQQNALTSEQTRLRTAQSTYLRDWTREFATTTDEKRISALLSAAKAFLGRDPLTSFSEASFDNLSRTVSGVLRVTEGNFSFSYIYTGEPSDEFLANRNRIEQIDRDMVPLKTALLQARTALNNVDSLERAARARIAEEVASRSGDQGKALVDGIKATVNIDSLIESLGIA